MRFRTLLIILGEFMMEVWGSVVQSKTSMLVRLAGAVGLALSVPLLSSCATTLPVPREILAEYDRGRPIIRLPLRYADGQPLRDARAYAGRFRDNGQIYMVGRGRFQLGPTTLFCIYNTEVEPAAQVPWRDSRVLSRVSEDLMDGVDNFIADTIYSERRDEFMLTPDKESSDSRACSTSRDAVHIRSSALTGRQSHRYLIEAQLQQGNVFHTFFLERNLQNPSPETFLVPLLLEGADYEDVVGHDTIFLGMMVGYYTRRLAE